MKPQIKWALAAAAVLLVGLFSLQQTGALWRSEANTAGGTLTAGKLDISAGTSGVKSFDLSGLALADAGRGDSVQKPLPVINSGNVTMEYKLNSIASTGTTPLTFRVATVANEAACTATGNVGTELYNGPANGAAFAGRQVAAGSTEYLCLRVTIANNAGTSQTANATYTFGASSVANA